MSAWAPLLLGAVAASMTPALALSPWAPGAQQAAVGAPLSARIDLVRGRAAVVSESAGHLTLRRGASKSTTGEGQLELANGCQARISLGGQVTLDVFGPSSLTWRSAGEGVELTFLELGWADVDVRSGEHELVLPADWTATFGRSSFHLRSLAGGPTELRHNAGTAVTLTWRGDETRARPPVSVYAGSSVRLDRPRYDKLERVSASQDASKAWKRDDRMAWPWRSRADTPEQARERGILSRETQVLREIPGSPSGSIGQVRAFEADGSSKVRPLRRRPSDGPTYAQVPVAPLSAPRVEIVARPGAAGAEPVALPTRPKSEPRVAAPVGAPKASTVPEKRPMAVPRVITKVPFVQAHWRGLQRKAINGVGELAAERGSGVELRVLGGGRTKVFVSASSPAPRWCFAPGADYLLSPGAVAVFEEDGTLRMSFGEVEEKASVAGRPSFSRLAD